MSTLSESDRELVLRVADVLIPPNATMPGLRAADPAGEWLSRACLARADLLDGLTDALNELAEHPRPAVCAAPPPRRGAGHLRRRRESRRRCVLPHSRNPCAPGLSRAGAQPGATRDGQRRTVRRNLRRRNELHRRISPRSGLAMPIQRSTDRLQIGTPMPNPPLTAAEQRSYTAQFASAVTGNFINGRWTSADSADTIEVFDPSTGDRIGAVVASSEKDADAGGVRGARGAAGLGAHPTVGAVQSAARHRGGG